MLLRLAAEEDAAHSAVEGTGHGSGDRTHDRSAEEAKTGGRIGPRAMGKEESYLGGRSRKSRCAANGDW